MMIGYHSSMIITATVPFSNITSYKRISTTQNIRKVIHKDLLILMLMLKSNNKDTTLSIEIYRIRGKISERLSCRGSSEKGFVEIFL